MKPDVPPLRDLVLLGGGHSHVQVLRYFGMHPTAGVRITLISQEAQSPYSGMLPGCVAGAYDMDDLHIDLGPLCRFAGARLIVATAQGIDLANQQVLLANRPPMRFDILSLNCGASPASGVGQGINVKPISLFLPAWQEVRTQLWERSSAATLAVVGAGAGGIELALASRASLPEQTQIQLIGTTLLPGATAGQRRVIQRALSRQRVTYIEDRLVNAANRALEFERAGVPLVADHVFWVTDVVAPPWLADSGLAHDERGFIAVDATLRSTSHPNVFAAGDIAHLQGQERPKAGVYAVRAGPTLAHNLARAARGGAFRPRKFRAQSRHLSLIGVGDGTAIALRGRWASTGRFWWRLKDDIDRRFMRRFKNLPNMVSKPPAVHASLQALLPDQQMRCGGCGAKLAADPLARVLARLPAQPLANVTLGMGDDAAEIVNAGPTTLLTVDGFRAMLDDPYLLGRIAAHHSMNDILAMGARPQAALALAAIPLMADDMMEEELFQLLSGAVAVLNEHQTPLVGGHSAEAAELSLGLTIVGHAQGEVMVKGGAAVGDCLLLTKPLGTGVVLAGAMQGLAKAQAVAACIAQMDTSNQPAVAVLREHGLHALTDITGFGLLGHLGEMLSASGCGVTLELEQVPLLQGATDLVAQGVRSSLQSANARALDQYQIAQEHQHHPALALLADPQTSGGMLAAVSAETATACLHALAKSGVDAALVGRIQAKPTMQVV